MIIEYFHTEYSSVSALLSLLLACYQNVPMYFQKLQFDVLKVLIFQARRLYAITGTSLKKQLTLLKLCVKKDKLNTLQSLVIFYFVPFNASWCQNV